MYRDPYSDAIRTLTLLKKLAAVPRPYEDERLKDMWKGSFPEDENFRRSPAYFESLRSLPYSPETDYFRLLHEIYEGDFVFSSKLHDALNRHGYAGIGRTLKQLTYQGISLVDKQGMPFTTIPAVNFLAPFLLNDQVIDSIITELDPVYDRKVINTLNTIKINRPRLISLTLDHLRKKYLANLSSAPIDKNKLQTIIYRLYNAESQLTAQEISDVWDVASAIIQRDDNTAQRFASMVEYLLIERILDLDAQGKDIEPLVKLIAHGYNSLSQDEKQALHTLAEEKLSEVAPEQPETPNQTNLNDPYYIATLAIGIPLTLLGIGLLATRSSGVGALLLLPGLFSLFAAALGKENVQRIFSLSSSEQVPQRIPPEEINLLIDTYVKKDILTVGADDFLDYLKKNQYRGDWQGVGEAFMDLTAFLFYRLEKNDLRGFISQLPMLSAFEIKPDSMVNNLSSLANRLTSGFESIWDTFSDETKRNLLDNETIREIENRGGISLRQVPVEQLKFDRRWLYSSRFRIKFGKLLGQIIEDYHKNISTAVGYSPKLVGLVDFMSDIPLLGSAVQSAFPGIVRYKQARQIVETLKSAFDINTWRQNPTLLQLFQAIDWKGFNKLQTELQSSGQW